MPRPGRGAGDGHGLVRRHCWSSADRADLLICEATFLSTDEHLARVRTPHSTTGRPPGADSQHVSARAHPLLRSVQRPRTVRGGSARIVRRRRLGTRSRPHPDPGEESSGEHIGLSTRAIRPRTVSGGRRAPTARGLGFWRRDSASAGRFRASRTSPPRTSVLRRCAARLLVAQLRGRHDHVAGEGIELAAGETLGERDRLRGVFDQARPADVAAHDPDDAVADLFAVNDQLVPSLRNRSSISR